MCACVCVRVCVCACVCVCVCVRGCESRCMHAARGPDILRLAVGFLVKATVGGHGELDVAHLTVEARLVPELTLQSWKRECVCVCVCVCVCEGEERSCGNNKGSSNLSNTNTHVHMHTQTHKNTNTRKTLSRHLSCSVGYTVFSHRPHFGMG